MRKEIFNLLKIRPLTTKEVVQKLKQPVHQVWATLEIMHMEGLLRKRLLGADLELYYGWPVKVEGKL